MIEEPRQSSRFAQKLFNVLLPETKRAVAIVDEWAVLGTLAGPVRSENQDRMVAGQFTATDSRTFRLVALSDGMGGLSHGQEAASLTLSSFLWCLTSTNGDMTTRIERAARYANRSVYEEFRGKSGATLSAVVVTDQGFPSAVNIGDSRIYGYSQRSRSLRQLSVDDTLAGLAEMGASVDARHNAGALLQYIGMGDELDPNVLSPQVLFGQDYILLSTDGVHWIGNKLLELIVQNAADHVQLARRLLQLAEMAGAHDNATLGILAPEALPLPALNGERHTLDVELWTPGGKTILIVDQGYGPGRSNITSDGQPTPRVAEPTPGQPRTAGAIKKPRKPKRKRPKPAASPKEQADLPMERPALVIEFGTPKREEDETSN